MAGTRAGLALRACGKQFPLRTPRVRELTAQHMLLLTSWRRGTVGEGWALSRWYIFIEHPDFLLFVVGLS